jgi:hypothetical protein
MMLSMINYLSRFQCVHVNNVSIHSKSSFNHIIRAHAYIIYFHDCHEHTLIDLKHIYFAIDINLLCLIEYTKNNIVVEIDIV